MSMLLRGAPAAAALNEKTAQLVSGLREKGVVPTLAIVRLGAREDDLSYERAAVKRCAAVGIETRCVSLPENASGEALEETLRALSADASVHGILLLRPLPAALDLSLIHIFSYAPRKKPAEIPNLGNIWGTAILKCPFVLCGSACAEPLFLCPAAQQNVRERVRCGGLCFFDQVRIIVFRCGTCSIRWIRRSCLTRSAP